MTGRPSKLTEKRRKVIVAAVRRGCRLGRAATEANIRAVIRVLRRWGETCARLADELEEAAQEEVSRREEDDGKA